MDKVVSKEAFKSEIKPRLQAEGRPSPCAMEFSIWYIRDISFIWSRQKPWQTC